MSLNSLQGAAARRPFYFVDRSALAIRVCAAASGSRPLPVEEANDESFAAAPNIYQSCVSKDHELRVVVFGEEIVCHRLDSQSRAFTSIDWRIGEGIIRGTVVQPPDIVRRQVRDFMAVAGLDTSVFDFAITPGGEAVFFESNPAGQWAGMEHPDRQECTTMIARQLVVLAEED